MLLEVDMCGLIVIDAGSTFCGTLANGCKHLGIWMHAASCGNNNAVSIKHFFHYFNKAVTFASSNCGTPLVLVEASMIATYAWNCSRIEGTDLVRNVPAMGQFKCHFNIALNAKGVPPIEPLSKWSNSVLTYIQYTSNHINFALQVVKLVVDNHPQVHRKHVDHGCSSPHFSPDDLVLVHVQVNSKAKLHCVAKLSYQVCRPFHVILHAAGNYNLVLIYKLTANWLSYPSQMLSPVPQGILPCTPLLDSPGF
jgi:hypothetical protein